MKKPETINNIPKVLLETNEWLVWYNKPKQDGTFTKPPLSQRGYTVKENSPGHSISQCITDLDIGDGLGFKLNDRHSFVFFDCDHVETVESLPKEFKEFIILQDTYMEWSPSGKGLRIVFKCIDKDKLIPGKGKSNLYGMDGELFVRSGHVTITGNHLAGEDVKEISAYQLEQWIKAPKAEIIDIPTEFNYPDISLVQEALRCCKLDQCDRVKLAYLSITHEQYNHYDYWLKIMAACHHYALETNQMNEVTSMIVKWSQTDEVAYESDEDIITHWSSFSQQESGIKFHTLMKFAKLLKFQWPDEKFDKSGSPTGMPIPTSLQNFKYLMEYYNIKIFSDIFDRQLYVTGDKEMIDKFYLSRIDGNTCFGMAGPFGEKYLNAVTCEMAQQNGYTGVAVNSISALYENYVIGRVQNINLFQKWLETPPEELPENMKEPNTDKTKSNIDYLMSVFTFPETQDTTLAQMFFDTLFYEMVMPIYNPERKLSQRSFMLILTGPEACRKTTFWTMLFPANLRRQFVTNSTETLGGAKSIRDFSASLVTSVIVVCDEFENFYNKKNDSLFKSLVTSDVIDYVPIYEKTMRKEHKNAVIVGTTNKRSLPFEQDSNRRLAMIDVRWIDTDAMTKINWHYFYRSYVTAGRKHTMNGLTPWKLNNKIIKQQYKANEEFRAQSNLEIIFREVWDFDINIKPEAQQQRYDKPGIQTNEYLYRLNQVEGTIRQQYPQAILQPAEFRHILKRLCGKYTDTINKRIPLKNAKNAYIENGIITQGQWKRYVLPPKKCDDF